MRREREASGQVFPSPVNRGVGVEEQPGDMQIRVIDLATLLHAMPSDGIRNDGGVRWAVVQGIGDAEEVADVLVFALECRAALAQMDSNGIRRDAHSPEQAIGVREDPGVEIVDLRREGIEVKLTYKDIQSDKAEGVVMDLPIDANIRALHEPHVRVEKQTARSCTLDFGGGDETVEVGDGRRLLAAG
jgi:hypothetical protein